MYMYMKYAYTCRANVCYTFDKLALHNLILREGLGKKTTMLSYERFNLKN